MTTTPYGAEFLFKMIAKRAFNHLTLQRIEGSLVSPLTIYHLQYRSSQIILTIDKLTLHWEPYALLTHQFFLHTLFVQNLEVNWLNKDATSKKTNLLNSEIKVDWLKKVMIENIHINNILIKKQNKPIYFLKDINLWQGRKNRYFFTSFGNDKVLQLANHCLIDFTINNDLLNIHQLKIYNTHGFVKISGSIGKKLDMNWNIAIPHIQEFYSEINGELYAKGNISGDFISPVINGNISANQLSYDHYKLENLQIKALQNNNQDPIARKIDIAVKGLAISDTHFNDIKTGINIYTKNKDLALDINSSIDNNNLKGHIILGNFSLLKGINQPVNGNLQIMIQNINTIIPPIQETRNLQGELSGIIHLSGTIQTPKFLIDLNLQQASMEIPRLGILLSEINLLGKMGTDRHLNFTGALKSGIGKASINGNINLNQDSENASNNAINLHLQGENLTGYKTNEYNIVMSPNLNLVSNLQETTITGNIFIPRAKIKPKDLTGTVSLPSEVVFVKKNENIKKPPNVNLDLFVKLGKNITVILPNLRTQLRGELHINKQLGTFGTATGELYTINGKYKAFGKSLRITRGRLIYAGNMLDNPGLSIRAVKELKKVEPIGKNSDIYGNSDLDQVHSLSKLTVGVLVEGTLNKPLLNLFSTPSLNQEDIISYLLFGYPQSQLSNSNKTASLAILNTVLASKNSNANFPNITKNIKKMLGLTQFKLGNTEYYDEDKQKISSATSFTVGKKIGKRLMINYTTGLSKPISILELKYQINKYLAIKSAKSSLETGADLVYEVEQN